MRGTVMNPLFFRRWLILKSRVQLVQRESMCRGVQCFSWNWFPLELLRPVVPIYADTECRKTNAGLTISATNAKFVGKL